MERREAVVKLKARIKQLAVEQKEDKKIIHQDHSAMIHARKKWCEENNYPHDHHYPFWAYEYRAAGPYKGPQCADDAFPRIGRRKIEITAALNVYLELLGKDYRHGEPEWYRWCGYKDEVRRMRLQYGLEEGPRSIPVKIVSTGVRPSTRLSRD